MHVAIPIKQYWSKKKGSIGAALKTVRHLDWRDPEFAVAYPLAMDAILRRRGEQVLGG